MQGVQITLHARKRSIFTPHMVHVQFKEGSFTTASAQAQEQAL